MSIFNYVYDQLVNDAELGLMLALNKLDGKPAVFEDWTPEFTEFPYINLTYDFSESDHFAKREGTLNVDIFGNKDSTELERIKNRVLFLLDRKVLNENEPDRARIYSRTDNPITEDDPKIKHWNLEFTVIFWRADFVENLNT